MKATVKQGRETLPVIIGTPLAGETLGEETFDGKTETAVFPGDLPENARDVFTPTRTHRAPRARCASCASARRASNARPRARPSPCPHIRLDRALQFLLGDRLA